MNQQIRLKGQFYFSPFLFHFFSFRVQISFPFSFFPSFRFHFIFLTLADPFSFQVVGLACHTAFCYDGAHLLLAENPIFRKPLIGMFGLTAFGATVLSSLLFLENTRVLPRTCLVLPLEYQLGTRKMKRQEFCASQFTSFLFGAMVPFYLYAFYAASRLPAGVFLLFSRKYRIGTEIGTAQDEETFCERKASEGDEKSEKSEKSDFFFSQELDQIVFRGMKAGFGRKANRREEGKSHSGGQGQGQGPSSGENTDLDSVDPCTVFAVKVETVLEHFLGTLSESETCATRDQKDQNEDIEDGKRFQFWKIKFKFRGFKFHGRNFAHHVSRRYVTEHIAHFMVHACLFSGFLLAHTAFVLSDYGKRAGYSIRKASFDGSHGSITILTVLLHAECVIVIVFVIVVIWGQWNYQLVRALFLSNAQFRYQVLCILLWGSAFIWVFEEHQIHLGGSRVSCF